MVFVNLGDLALIFEKPADTNAPAATDPITSAPKYCRSFYKFSWYLFYSFV